MIDTAKATATGILTTQMIFLVLRTQKDVVETSASLPADALGIAGVAGVAWLSYMDHQRSLRPSTLLGLYLSVLAIVAIARVRTLWLIENAIGEAATMTVILALTLLALLLESIEKKSSIVEKRPHSPEEYSGFWTRTAFVWLTATFRAGYSKILVQDDLPILDTRLRSNVLRENLVSTWEKCKYTQNDLYKD